jgi:DNA-binding MarR family transcriptional regulator
MPAVNPTSEGPQEDSIRWGRDQWEAKYGHEHASAMEVFSALLRTREVLTEWMNQRLEKLDLTWIDYDLLSVVEFIGGGAMALGKIRFFVRRFIIHQTSITNVVARLVERGIVTTNPDANDGRVTMVQLTALGRRRLRRAHTILAEEDFGLGSLSKSQQTALIELLYTIRLDHDDVHPISAEPR